MVEACKRDVDCLAECPKGTEFPICDMKTEKCFCGGGTPTHGVCKVDGDCKTCPPGTEPSCVGGMCFCS
ncbi:hypothetical protein CDL15_Pgr014041 [Punica granatum]|nr:hypothetical protein CDL15_Pgr014041 [Punica granatum]